MQTLERLAEEIVCAAGDIEAAMCRWLGMVAEFDRREGWAQEGCRSCSAWVAWRCGLSPAAARERVRIARRLEELPAVRAAFARGELTYSKVRALTRIEEVEREAELVELALTATASQLDRMVGAYSGVARTAAGAVHAHAERSLTWHFDDDGSLVVRGRLTADDGAALVAAIEAVRDEAAISASAEALSAVPARNADALVTLVEAGAASGGADRTGGERFQVVVHVDADVLTGASAGPGEVEHGPALAGATARRLACDASVVRIVERDGRPLSVGRKTRTIPPAIRRALRARDGGCQFPGCDRHRHVDAHHVEHWARGGETSLANLVLLCRHHHRLVHEGGYTVAADRAAFVFHGPDGRAITPRPRRSRGCRPLGPRASAEAPLQRAVERMDLGYAVDALLDFAPLRPSPPQEQPRPGDLAA